MTYVILVSTVLERYYALTFNVKLRVRKGKKIQLVRLKSNYLVKNSSVHFDQRPALNKLLI